MKLSSSSLERSGSSFAVSQIPSSQQCSSGFKFHQQLRIGAKNRTRFFSIAPRELRKFLSNVLLIQSEHSRHSTRSQLTQLQFFMKYAIYTFLGQGYIPCCFSYFDSLSLNTVGVKTDCIKRWVLNRWNITFEVPRLLMVELYPLIRFPVSSGEH